MASFVRDVGSTGASVNINAQSNFPQIQFVSTGNTFSIGADSSGNFKISDNTSIGTNDRITIDNTGNVGIGITIPVAKLHIGTPLGSGSTTEEFRIQTGTSSGFGGTAVVNLITGTFGTSGIYFGNNGSLSYNNQPAKVEFNQASNAVNYNSTQYHNWQVGGSTRMTLNGNNAGIGTTNPQGLLHISSDSTPTLIIGTKTANQANSGAISFRELESTSEVELRYNGADNAFKIWTSLAGDALTVLRSNGNVGIGAPSPQAKLDVNGGVRIANDAAAASATNVGTLRYRTSGNNSYVDMVMQTGASTYAWVNIVENNW
jgi:hypothetical protein